MGIFDIFKSEKEEKDYYPNGQLKSIVHLDRSGEFNGPVSFYNLEGNKISSTGIDAVYGAWKGEGIDGLNLRNQNIDDLDDELRIAEDLLKENEALLKEEAEEDF